MSQAARAKAKMKQQQHMSKLPGKFKMKIPGRKGTTTYNALQMMNQGFMDTRKGLELWSLLRSRLRMMMTMRRDWGNIDDVYGHCQTEYDNFDLPWYIRDPTSDFSTAWDLMQVSQSLLLLLPLPPPPPPPPPPPLPVLSSRPCG